MSGQQFVCPATDTGCPALAFIAGRLDSLESSVDEIKCILMSLSRNAAVEEYIQGRRAARTPWYARLMKFIARVAEERFVECTIAILVAALGGAIGFSSCHSAPIPIEASPAGLVR